MYPSLDAIYRIQDIDAVFDELFAELGMNITTRDTDNKTILPYTIKMHLNMSRVSQGVKQKICQVSALDY